MDSQTIQQYTKLAKVSQGDKQKKAVEDYIQSDTKKPRKTSMSVNSKAFFPKSQPVPVKPKSGSFDCSKAKSGGSIDSCSTADVDPLTKRTRS